MFSLKIKFRTVCVFFLLFFFVSLADEMAEEISSIREMSWMVFESYEIIDLSGDDDGVVDPGESIEFSVALRNVGVDTAYSLTGALRTEDSYVTITDSLEEFGDVLPDSVVWSMESFGFDVAEDCPSSHAINFELVTEDAEERIATNAFSIFVLTGDIFISEDTINFNTAFIGYTDTLEIEISNIGDDILFVNDIVFDNSDYSVNITDFILSPGASQDVKVMFTPTSEGLSEGNLFALTGISDTSRVVLMGEGLEPPDISISPDSLVDSLLVGEVSTNWLKIYNTGFSDLIFRVSIDVSVEEMLSRILNNSVSINNSNSNKFEYLEVGKDEVDPRIGVPVILGAGGPDSFGYTWMDSDEGVSCQFDWIDITSTGTQVVGLSDDNFVGPYPLSFEFPFYDSAYTEFYISSNGYIGFGPTSGYSSRHNQYIPLSATPNNFIAWCWDDLYPNGSVYYQDLGQKLVIQFVDYGEYGGSGKVNAEIIMFRSGSIIVQYLNTYNSFDILGGTIGIENEDGSGGLEVAFNTEYIHDSLAVKFSRGLSWLSAEPILDTVHPEDSVLVGVTFDAAYLCGGNYFADLVLASNDPDEQEISIPARVRVTGVSDINVSEDSLDFSTVLMGYSSTDTLIIYNKGTDSLRVSDISSNNSDFLPEVTNFSLFPGETGEVVINFTPSIIGDITGALTITSNDPDESPLGIALKGECMEPPDISISPDSLNGDLFAGEKYVDTLAIYNTGLGNLIFDISIEEASVMAFKSFPDNILIMEEGSDSLYYDRALNNLGLSRTLVTSWSSLRSELKSGIDWDIVIVNSCGSNAPTAVLDLLDAYQSNGGLLIYSHWGLYRYPSHSLLTGLGISFISDFTTPINFYAVDTEHALFTKPNAVSNFYWSDDPWNRDGQIVDTIGGATQMAYFEGYTDKGAVVLNAGQNCIFNAFQTSNFNADGDGDGKVDIVELFENEIVLLLRPWLIAYPFKGEGLADSTIYIKVSFDATCLYGGDYDRGIVISSNDPDEPEVIIPAHLHVTGIPDISVAEDTLDLGNLFVGLSITDTLIVSNEGTDSLFVSNISSDNSDFTFDINDFGLEPGESQEIPVTFSPSVVGTITGMLSIESNDPDEPIKEVFLRGEGLSAPVITVEPYYISDTLTTGESETHTLNIGNTGGNNLTFEIMYESVKEAGAIAALNKNQITLGVQNKIGKADLLSQTVEIQGAEREFQSDKPEGSSTSATRASYSGDYLQFKLSDYGEIFSLQYPAGTEHLRIGNYLSGYTICYNNGEDKVEWAGYEDRSGIETVSYNEIVNDVDSAVIDVITETSGGELTIIQRFTFDKHDKFIRIKTNVENTGETVLNDIVFKKWADWDMDEDYSDDSWDYDITHNMIYVWDEHYGALAGQIPPDYRDIEGWDDYNRMITDEDYIDGPIMNFDGLEILHYELGSLSPREGRLLTFTYGAADNLIELKSVIERGIAGVERFTASPDTGTVLVGVSTEVEVVFDATSLFSGDYYANFLISSNDPITPIDTILCFLHVGAIPIINLSADTLEFDSVSVGSVDTLELRIQNNGTDNLQITNISSDNPNFSVDITNFTLIPDASRLVKVIFTPRLGGQPSGNLTIESNDPAKSNYTIVLIRNAHSGIEKNIPKIFFISANHPNPFCDATVIKYGCPERTKVSIKVFDIMGRLVNTLIDKEMDAGYHEVSWSGSTKSGKKAASSVYFYKMKAGDFEATRKMVLAK